MATVTGTFDPLLVVECAGVLTLGFLAYWLVPWFLRRVFVALGLEYDFGREEVRKLARARKSYPVTPVRPTETYRFYRSGLGYLKTNGFNVFYLLLQLAIAFGTLTLAAWVVQSDFWAALTSFSLFGVLTFLAIQIDVRNIRNGIMYRLEGDLRIGYEVETQLASGYLVAFRLEGIVLLDSSPGACYDEESGQDRPWTGCREYHVSYNQLRDQPFSVKVL